jgi:hypothetical protein
MKFLRNLVMLTLLAILLSACNSGEKTATKAKKYAPIPHSAIQSTIDDMKTREHIKDATFTVAKNKIEMKLTVDDPNLTDKSAAQSYADSYLRVISNYVDGSNPKASGDYGKVYDGYYVHITVEDTQGMQLIEGDKYPSFKSITWQ